MIKSTFGITKEPFLSDEQPLLAQQESIFEIIRAHSQHGGLSVITGEPGTGKTVLKEHIERLAEKGDTIVVSFSRTMHTYLNILTQLGTAMKIDCPVRELEKEIIHAAFQNARERKTIYTLIDEAHLIDMQTLRKLRLLFDQFPRKHNLVLLGQSDLMYYLSMRINEDIKTRITFSQNLLPLNDDDLKAFILSELQRVKLGANTFDESALELILRSVQGNLRICCNLCYGSLLEACRQSSRIVTIRQVNDILVQPHWRSHEDLIRQQVK